MGHVGTGSPPASPRARPTWPEVLAPFDPRAACTRGVDVAAGLALRTGAPLRLLAVQPPGAAADGVRAGPAAALERARRIAGDDAAVHAEAVPYGSVTHAIVDAARPGTLVCMASAAGRHGAHTLAAASTAERVLAAATVPVLLVGPEVRAATWSGDARIVACLDGTRAGERAVPVARTWAQDLGLPLWLAHVDTRRSARSQAHVPVLVVPPHGGSGAPHPGAGGSELGG